MTYYHRRVNFVGIAPGILAITPASGTPQAVTSTSGMEHDGYKIDGDAPGGSDIPNFESGEGNSARSSSAVVSHGSI